LWERLCKRAQEGKNREPEDRELERTYTTNTIRDSTCDPTTQRRRDQRHTTDQSGFRFINAEDRNERWNSQREHLHIKSIKPQPLKHAQKVFLSSEDTCRYHLNMCCLLNRCTSRGGYQRSPHLNYIWIVFGFRLISRNEVESGRNDFILNI